MIYDLHNEYDLLKFDKYVEKLRNEGVVVEIKRKTKRTLAQNNYLHLILAYFGSQYGCGLDEAKLDYYKRLCNKDIFERTTTGRRGETITILRSSASLTTEELSLSIDRFRNWSASVAGIYLPDANEHQMLLYAQQEVERNKEYINYAGE